MLEAGIYTVDKYKLSEAYFAVLLAFLNCWNAQLIQGHTTMKYGACNIKIITCMSNSRNTQEISKSYYLRGLRNSSWI